MTKPYSAGSKEDISLALGTNPNVKSVRTPNTNEQFAAISKLAADASTGEPHAGGTMNVNTFKVAQPEDNQVFVGGERGSDKRLIGTQFEGANTPRPSISPLSILQHAQRIREATGGRPNAHVGLWLSDTKPEKGIYVDASGGFDSEKIAQGVMRSRPAEQGAFSLRKLRETGDGFVPNESYDETKDPTSDNYKGN